MKVLITFGTTEGQTRKIAEAVAAHLRDRGHQVDVFDTAGSTAGVSVAAYDHVILAGSVHDKRHQELLEAFVMARLSELQQRPTLFLSISLSAAFPEGQSEAKSYVNTFLNATGWRPTRSLTVAGALRQGEYDYFQRQIVEHLVLRGRQLEGDKEEYDFTDWPGLYRAVDAFLEEA